MDVDVVRILDSFARDVARLPAGSVPRSLVERTFGAMRAALTCAAGQPDESLWRQLYAEAGRLVVCLEDRSALPGLRAFLAENVDLREQAAELVPW
jgi:hypothetical protein